MDDPRALYLDLLERCLLDALYDPAADTPARAEGRDWPARAHTMVGAARLRHLRGCVEDLLARGVPGDLVEAGVWRGGAAILMRGVLAAHGDRGRSVWLADSFAGLPAPEPARYPADAGGTLHTFAELAVPLEAVRGNFRRYGLLDDRVRFLPGWFADTLPQGPPGPLALVRLDGDLYASTAVALRCLYDRLAPGGYLVVDDYGAVPGCRQAVHDFRATRGIAEPIRAIDWAGAYWIKAGGPGG